MLKSFATVIVTSILTSAFWIFYFGIAQPVRDGMVTAAGDKKTVATGTGTNVALAEGVTVGPAGLAVPVAGIKPAQLVDTFTQARAGGARVHDAIDIMAPAGTPVVAAAPGRVEKLFFSQGGGGITAYVRSQDGRWIYYYAHMRGYASGLSEGQEIMRGATVGYVGASGNAAASGPHLHFAINRMAAGERWYQGTPINPYPLLAARPAAR